MKSKRGDFGYIDGRKKKILLIAGILTAVAVAIFVTGLLLNDMSKRNVFTVIAVLFALPVAKQIVALVVLWPYHSVDKAKYEQVKEKLPEDVTLYTDLVITSAEKVMQLDFVVVGYEQVIGLVGKSGQDITYLRKYLRQGVTNWGDDYHVKIVDSEKMFLGELDHLTACEVDEEEQEHVKSYLRSLIV